LPPNPKKEMTRAEWERGKKGISFHAFVLIELEVKNGIHIRLHTLSFLSICFILKIAVK
jgi:hypothetical protein